MDTFDDLVELGIDVSATSTDLSNEFNRAAKHLPSLLVQLDTKTTLEFYAFYKQATEGCCNIPKPWFYDTKAKAKYDAWQKLGQMPRETAQQCYVTKIRELDPNFLHKPTESWARVSNFQATEQNSTPTIVDHIRAGKVDEVRAYLLKNNVEKYNGMSLLHWAADSGQTEVVKVLLDHGMELDDRDDEGQTALHYAASCGHKGCVQLLLDHGASKTVEDNEGLCPRMVAFDETVMALLL